MDNLAREVPLEFGPQPGPQTLFLESTADIVFYGGAAGGGKTYALLLETLRHWDNPQFGSVIFRRNSVQVRNEGGLWDESTAIFSHFGAHPREAYLEWQFPIGMRVKFAHLEHEKNVFDWQGAQIAMLGFDEITHFTETQFVYMLSRNRSTSGVPGYVRCTCNPDVDSWVRKWLDWYIGADGFPIPERSGVIRYFIRQDDITHWANTKEELLERFGPKALPKSFTFIPSKVQDNKILLSKDPSYLSNLNALSRVDRMRLLEGNWNVRAVAGSYFQRPWFEVIDTLPGGWIDVVRYWDRAATKPNEVNPDPDWTAGLKMYRYGNGTYVVADVQRVRDTPGKVENFIKAIASQDGSSVTIFGEQDPGSAGVADAGNFTKMLAGYDVRVSKPTTDKETRAKPVSAQCEAGNVKILRGIWNDEFFRELESFPEGSHDDQVDVLSGAFNELNSSVSMFDVMGGD